MGSERPAGESCAKLARPATDKVLKRERLFRLIDTGSKKPVIWITSPAGSGKTTLVSSYIDSRGLPCVWYQMDGADTDPATFFYYMGLAAKKAAPRKRRPMPLLTPEYMLGIPTFSFRFFEELGTRIKDDTLLVFDDYHAIPGNSPIHEIIREGLHALPDGITTIFVSRNAPPSAFARHRANGTMNELGWDELQLTLQESKKIVELRGGDSGMGEKLHQKTDGWAAGLVLMHASGKVEISEDDSREHIFDYFASEVFRKMDERTREFLLKTSILPAVQEAVASELTGIGKSRAILRDLSRNNYFTVGNTGEAPSYKYHPLFKDFLLEELKTTYSEKEIRELRDRAAVLLTNKGRAEDAARLFTEAADWGGLVGLVINSAQDLIMQGRTRIVEEWLGWLPVDIRNSNPWLFYYMGVCRMSYNPVEARDCFERSFSGFREMKDHIGAYLAWAGTVNTIPYGFDNLRDLDKWQADFQKLQNEYRSPLPPQVETLVSTNYFTLLAMFKPEDPDVLRWAERSLDASRASADINSELQALFFLSHFHLFSSETSLFKRVMEEAMVIYTKKGTSPFSVINISQMKIIYHLFSGEYDESLKCAADGLRIADETGVHVIDGVLRGNAAVAHLCVDEIDEFRAIRDKMEQDYEKGSEWDKYFCRYIAAKDARLRGEWIRAKELLEWSLKWAERVGYGFSIIASNNELAYICLRMDNVSKAKEHLSMAKKAAGKRPFFVFVNLLSEAYLFLKTNDRPKGMKLLKKAISLGKRQGYLSTYWQDRNVTRYLFTEAFVAGIEQDYVRTYIRKNRFTPDEGLPLIPDWPWPVRIRTLGTFEVQVDERPVKHGGKSGKKPLDLLKALLSMGGQEVHVQKISDALWPDANGDTANISFKTNLHRLRKLLGNDKTLIVREGRIGLNPKYCWLDSWSFEEEVASADVEWNQGSIDDAVSIYRRALNIYEGAFLSSDIDHPWTAPMRERMKSRYLRALTRMSRYFENAGDFRKAVVYYRLGLEADELREDIARGLIRCYHRLGRKSDVVRTCARIRKSLQTLLGVSPDQETEALCLSILK